MIDISEKDGAVIITVRVVPRASRSEIAGEMDGAVKVRITSPPVDGAANAELIKLFAKTLGVSKSQVEIISGQASKTKLVQITGVTTEQARKMIG